MSIPGRCGALPWIFTRITLTVIKSRGYNFCQNPITPTEQIAGQRQQQQQHRETHPQRSRIDDISEWGRVWRCGGRGHQREKICTGLRGREGKGEDWKIWTDEREIRKGVFCNWMNLRANVANVFLRPPSDLLLMIVLFLIEVVVAGLIAGSSCGAAMAPLFGIFVA